MKNGFIVLISFCVAGLGPARAQEGNGDASGLPTYKKVADKIVGKIRNHGNGYAGVLKKWEDGFREIYPEIYFADTLPTSDAAFPALITGVTDLAPDGSEPALTESLAFFEVNGYDATAVTVATGAFDTEGHSPGVVVFVHRENPLRQLTLDQLDGIFGAERTGGLRGFKWSPEDARGPEKNLRTWGQVGLGGTWTSLPIQTYGHAPSGASRFFQGHILKNSDKWNANYRGYVETGSKMIGDSDRVGQKLGIRHMLAEELAHDRTGIAWTIMPQAKGIAGIKPVALAASPGGPYILPSRESFQNRSYPSCEVYTSISIAGPGPPSNRNCANSSAIYLVARASASWPTTADFSRCRRISQPSRRRS